MTASRMEYAMEMSTLRGMEMKRRCWLVIAVMAVLASIALGADGGKGQASGGGAKLVIAANGASDYVIVVPDGDDPRGILKEAAETLQSFLTEAAGCKLPICKEAESPADKGHIYLGRTKAAVKAGVPVEALKGNEFHKRVVGRDIFLAGFDAPVTYVPNNPKAAYRGTLKAVTSFLEDEVGVRFLLPGPNGVHVPKSTEIVVDGALNVAAGKNTPYTSPKTGDIYDVGNNYFNYWFLKTYGGHSYYDAVPKEKYGKTHPEYFALAGGQRVSTFNHLCISNPEVRKLMLEEMDKWFAMGYEWYELAQTDGYRPCECDACKAIAGDDCGEALWITHRKLAEDARKKWPGRKIVIIAYGPTAPPPKTFDTFPDNVIIEMCSYSPERFKQYEKFGVEKMTYVYNWGAYNTVGFLPKRTPVFAGRQIRLFAANSVRAIYKCGFGENLGLEGPVYYVWGKLLLNPEADPLALADDFYRAAYGKARTPMKGFYDELYRRLELNSNVPASENPKFRGAAMLPQTPEDMITTLFPPSLVISMEENLKQAFQMESDPRVQARLRLVEREFLYLKNIVSIFDYYRAYRLSDSWEAFDLLEKELKRRGELIDSWYSENPAFKTNPKAARWQMSVVDGWPWSFGNPSKEFLREGGRLSGKLAVPPFSWNMTQLRETKQKYGPDAFKNKALKVPRLTGDVKPGGMPDEAAWRSIPAEELREIGCGELKEATTFRVARDDANLYLLFVCKFADIAKLENYTAYGRDGGCYGGECLEIFIDPFGTREKYYHLAFGPVAESYYDASYGFIEDQLDPGFGKSDKSWNGVWEYHPKIDKENKRWTAQVKIPFSTLGVSAPKPNDQWTMNVGRESVFETPNNPEGKRRELSTWSPNLEERSFHALGKFGTITFE